MLSGVSGLIGLLNGVLKFADVLARYLHDRKMIEAGKAKATLHALSEARKEMDKVAANRARYKHDPAYADRLRESFRLPPE